MERAKFAKVDSILAALSCPLCFEVVKNCVVTSCGHSFCRSCAGDAVSRKHICPVCQKGVIGGEAGLIRNFLVDEVTESLHRASDATDVAYMRLLFENASSPSSPAARSPTIQIHETGTRQTDDQGRGRPVSSAEALSPIEAVLVNRIREAFLGYQAYYERERAAHEAEVQSLSAQLEALGRGDVRGDLGGASGEVGAEGQKVEALKAAIEDSRARFAAGMEALLKDFDSHAAAAVPPPSLLPATVTVIIASRGVRFDTQLLPTHFPENVYNKVRSYYASNNDEVRGFGPGTCIYLQALSTTRTFAGEAAQPPQTHHPISSPTQTVFSQSPGGRIGAGWALVVDGSVLLASEELKPCFAREFGQPGREPGERVDYFRCGECKLNWLCAACATHCHRACRDVKPFSLNHLPSWGCCYCNKKRARIGCKLSDGAQGTPSS